METLHWAAGLGIFALAIFPIARKLNEAHPGQAPYKPPLSKEEKEMQRLNEMDRKERRARDLKLTYSPREKIWLGIAVISWIAIWVFLV